MKPTSNKKSSTKPVTRKRSVSSAKRKSSSSGKSLLSSKLANKRLALIFVALFALVGIYFVYQSFAATTLAVIEAESLTLPAGANIVSDSTASSGQAIRLNANGTVTGSVTLAAPGTSLTVRAKGLQCQGAPQMVVKVDGMPVPTNSVSSTIWADYTAPVNLTANTHSINVAFINDYNYTHQNSRKNCTRDLFVDKLTFFGADPTPTPTPTNSLSANITVPTSGSTVAGGVPVEAKPTSPNGISKVEFFLDGVLYRTEGIAPYCMAQDAGAGTPCYNWDSASVVDGSHIITAYAYDSAGVKSPASTSTFTVSNAVITPPGGSPSGVPMPTGDVTSGGHTWKPIFSEDFTKDAPLGSWDDAGTLTACPYPQLQTVYTGATGTVWHAYPKCYKDTFQARPYRSDKVLSVHDGSLDFWLHTVDGRPAGANPAPVLPSGSSYQTYGRYEARFRTTTTNLSEYLTAWLLWPTADANYRCAESDYPDGGNLSLGQSWYFAHWGSSLNGSCTQPDINPTQQDSGTVMLDKTQWHTYTQEWMPGKRNYYLDGKLLGSSTNAVWDQPERWQLQTETKTTCDQTSPITCSSDGHILVDWAVVYGY